MNHEPQFLTRLSVTPLDGVNWELLADLRFRDHMGNLHVVHRGFVTDFASIPSLSRIGAVIMLVAVPLLPVVFWLGSVFLAAGFGIVWLADELNGDDLLDAPAVLHDEGYRRARLGRNSWQLKFYWDWILFVAMRANGEPLWKCWLIWFNVAAFGWAAWYQDGRNHD